MYDDFNRGASTDLGPLWNEVSGNWLLDGAGKLIGQGAGTIVTTDKNTWSRRGVALTGFTPTGSGPWEVKIFVNAEDNASAKTAVTVAFNEDQCTLTAGGQSKVFNKDTTPPSKPGEWLWPGAVGNDFYFIICYTNGMLYISVQDVTSGAPIPPFIACLWEIDITLPGGRSKHAGLEIVSGNFEFDYFRYSAHRHDDVIHQLGDDPYCEECTCYCGTFGDEGFAYPPWRIRVDFICDDCPCCFDGGYLIFETLHCGTEAGNEEWYICVDGGVCGVDRSINGVNPSSLDCGSTLVGNWILRWGIGGCSWELNAPTSVTCDPFYIVWDFVEGDVETTCGWGVICDPGTIAVSFYAEATDASY